MKGSYGKSASGNFEVVDVIGVPHPYMITAKHVAHASDRGGILNPDAVESAESHGARCGQRGCTLSYKEHEQALLVNCKIDIKGEDGKASPELHQYLLGIKDEATKNGYAGFAFKRA